MIYQGRYKISGQFWRKAVGITFLALVVSGIPNLIHRHNQAKAATVFPGSSWATATPAAVGMDAAKLDAFVDAIDNISSATGVVVKNGYVVKSWGNQTTKIDWASAAKPVVSTMLFFAMRDDLISSPNDLIANEGWSLSTKDQTMTYHHLANMVSGYSRGEAPGAAWAYNDYGIELYVKTLFDRVYETSANTAALDPTRLGALDLEDGSLFSSRGSYGVSTTPRTMARIGWLWLNRGTWNSEELLPESFFDTYMQNQVATTVPRTSSGGSDYLGIGTYGGSSDQTSVGPGFYGYGWWFNTNQAFWPDAPADTFQANGHFGTEVMMVIPSLNIVVAAKGTWGGFDPGNANSTMNQNLKLLVESVLSTSVELDAAETPTADATPTVTGTASGGSAIASVEYQTDTTNGGWHACTATDSSFDEASETFSCNIASLADGSHTIYIRATGSDATVSDPETATIAVDTGRPGVTFTGAASDPTNDTTPSFSGTATDTVSAIASAEYQMDGTSGSWSPCAAADGAFDEASEEFTCIVASALADGSHTVYTRATDAAGNVTGSGVYAAATFTLTVSEQWTQTDWSGGAGQSAWSDSSRFLGNTHVTASTTGQVSLEAAGSGGPSWYNSSWQYRKAITLQESKVSGSLALSNFPVLVSKTDTGLRDNARSDGNDILFVGADGTKLDHEIEAYTSASGTLVAWVEVPSLSATADTVIYMYYGNPQATSQENRTGVWDANYQAVWHLHEASGTRNDSTANANALTDTNTVPQATGKIGYGTSHDNTQPESFTRSNAALNSTFPGKVASGAVTASTWVNVNHFNSGHTHNLLVKGTTAANFIYAENQSTCFNFGGVTGCSPAGSVTAGSWYYLSTVYDGSTVRMYVNGVQSGTTTALAAFPTGTQALTIGRRSDTATNRALGGFLDESRISNTARSADWISAEYANQSDPSTFLTVGSAEQNTAYQASGTLTSSIFDAGAAGTWGTLEYDATTPAGTAVMVKIRTSNSPTMSGASAFSSCAAIASGADISSASCVSDGHRYIQYELTLSASDTSQTPLFENLSIAYAASNEDPALSLDGSSATTTDATPSFSGTAADPDDTISAVEYQVDSLGGSWSACVATDGTFDEAAETFTCTTGSLSDGTHAIHVRALDSGDGISDGASVAFTVDATAPTLASVSIASSNADGTFAKPGSIITITFSSSEAIETPEVAITSGGVAVEGGVTIASTSPTAWSAEYAAGAADTNGPIAFTIAFSDIAGNAGTTVHATTDASAVTFDKTAPTLAEVTPVASSTSSTSPHYVFSSTEAGTIAYDGGCTSSTAEASAGENSIAFDTLAIGNYPNCTIQVTDAAGNTSSALPVTAFTIIAEPTAPEPEDPEEEEEQEPPVAESTTTPTSTPAATSEQSASAASTIASDAGSLPVGAYNPPLPPAGGFGIRINNGTAATANRIVSLSLTGGPDTPYMEISMTGDFKDAGREAYRPEKIWDLCSKFTGIMQDQVCPPGTYTVYVRFLSPYGQPSPAVSARIVLAGAASGATMTLNVQTRGSAGTIAAELFSRTLQIGMHGFDVRRLQVFLNRDTDTRVAVSGAGSPLRETSYFGILTKQAVMRFQEKYAGEILTPLGLRRATGIAGQATLRKIYELLGTN
jgi:hypothetical protein